MKKIFKDKVFISTLIALALPIICQNLITSSLNLLDNVMVGKLGEAQIASIGLANQFFFIFMLTMIGVNAGAAIFMSQFWGQKDIKSIKKFLGIDLTIGFITSGFFALLAGFFPEFIMRIFTNDTTVINLGVSYLKMVALSYIFTNISLGFSFALRSTNQAKIPMYASILGLIANAILNYSFIFGNFGMPAMGVSGAALGTTISRFLEMSFILLVIYVQKNIVAGSFKEIFCFNIGDVKTYFKTATPVILNDIMWSTGITTYSIAYAQIGTDAVASMQIATTINNMFNIFGIGLANATAIMIGNKIGSKEEDTAIEYANNILKLSVLMGALIGTVVLIFTPFILGFFKISEHTYHSTLSILKIMAIITPLRFYNIVIIIGVLRGGGDVAYAIITELIAVWAFAVPLAFLGAVVLKLDVVHVYLLIALEEVFKIFFEVPRLRSSKWLKNVVSA